MPNRVPVLLACGVLLMATTARAQSPGAGPVIIAPAQSILSPEKNLPTDVSPLSVQGPPGPGMNYLQINAGTMLYSPWVRLTQVIDNTEVHVYVTQAAPASPPVRGYARFVKVGARLTSINGEGADWPCAVEGNTIWIDTSEVWSDTAPAFSSTWIVAQVIGELAADVQMALFVDLNAGGGQSATQSNLLTNEWIVETWQHVGNWTSHFTRDYTNGTIFADIALTKKVADAAGTTSFVVPTGWRPTAGGATTTMTAAPVSRLAAPSTDPNGQLSIDLDTATCSVVAIGPGDNVYERWLVAWSTADARPPQPPTGGAPVVT